MSPDSSIQIGIGGGKAGFEGDTIETELQSRRCRFGCCWKDFDNADLMVDGEGLDGVEKIQWGR